MGRQWGENGGKDARNKKLKWYVQNRQGKLKNRMGNGEAKDLVCMTHGHELSWGGILVGGVV